MIIMEKYHAVLRLYIGVCGSSNATEANYALPLPEKGYSREYHIKIRRKAREIAERDFVYSLTRWKTHRESRSPSNGDPFNLVLNIGETEKVLDFLKQRFPKFEQELIPTDCHDGLLFYISQAALPGYKPDSLNGLVDVLAEMPVKAISSREPADKRKFLEHIISFREQE